MKVSPRLRPVPGGGVPPGVSWTWVERPADPANGAGRQDVPASRHRYGVVTLGRDLTAAELDHFDLTVIGDSRED